MKAILSDIHGNLEALNAVLSDASSHSVTSIICLGDTVGYGPDSLQCLTIAMEWPVHLLGNFEHAIVSDTSNQWPHHLSTMMDRLQQHIKHHALNDSLWKFLKTLPTSHTDEKVFFVHGSPRDPIHEYSFPEHIYDERRMSDVFSNFEQLCFCGHSHIAGLFTSTRDGWEYLTPAQCDNAYTLRGDPVLCNVGSVGQPRDGDPRASYVLFDGTTITFRRVDYDIEKTIAKIRSGDDDDMHGDRLPLGR